MFPLHYAAFGAMCALLPFATTAATAPPALRTAVHELWADSPQVQAAQAQREAARARAHAAAQPLYNPTLNLDGENADVDRRTLGASLAVDVTGKRRARMAQSDADVRASDAAYAWQRRDVASQWLKAWASSALAQAQVDTGRRRVELMRRFDALAAQRLAVGDIGSPERDLAALAFGEAQWQQATLEAQEAAARATLTALGGPATDRLPAMPRELPPPADLTPLPLDERPDIAQAHAEQQRAESAVTVARRARLPDPTFSVTGGHVRSGARSDRVIGLSVSIPLPVLNTGRADIVAAQADADAALAATRVATLRADATLSQAQVTYTSLRHAAAGFRAGRSGAFDERAALLERLWQAREIGTSDYLVQLRQSLDTALAGQALEGQLWQAWFDYLATAGRLDEWIDGPRTETTTP